jgi:hypothetical protein
VRGLQFHEKMIQIHYKSGDWLVGTFTLFEKSVHDLPCLLKVQWLTDIH